MPKYYIASSLKNVEQVRSLRDALNARGWEHTYDWTVHGSVAGLGEDVFKITAEDESVGVIEADVVIVLLPGGRGTHTELGMVLGTTLLAMALQVAGIAAEVNRRICIFSPDPERDFGTTKDTCAFYHHPLVERFSSMDEMIVSLTEKK